MTIDLSTYKPNPKQEMLHKLHKGDLVDEALFGGAVGGGKSMGLVEDVLIYGLSYVGSNSLLIRKTYAELYDAIIKKCLLFYPKNSYDYNDTKKIMTFKWGSTLQFGYLAHKNDIYKYQGGEWSYIGFDELTHFSEEQYLYLRTRNRNSYVLKDSNGNIITDQSGNPRNYPNITRSSANPLPVAEWVKARFITKKEPFKIHTITEELSGEILTRKIVYIPSTLDDNPYINRTDYLSKLTGLTDAQKTALIKGDWDFVQGEIFTSTMLDIIDEEFVRNLAQYSPRKTVMVVDIAVTTNDSSDFTGITIADYDQRGTAYIHKAERQKLLSDGLSDKLIEYIRQYELTEIVFEETGISTTFIQEFEKRMRELRINIPVHKLKPAGRNKIARIQQFILSAMQQKKLFFVNEVGPSAREELINFPNSDHDDVIDSIAYLLEFIASNTTGQNESTPINKYYRKGAIEYL